MTLPGHIAAAVRQAHSQLPDQPESPADAVAKRVGGIPLFSDVRGTLVMLVDGTVVEVRYDDEDAKPIQVSREDITLGLVAGARRYPWLSELIPRRPANAVSCFPCGTTGELAYPVEEGRSDTLWCGSCHGLGWHPMEEPRGGPTKS